MTWRLQPPGAARAAPRCATQSLRSPLTPGCFWGRCRLSELTPLWQNPFAFCYKRSELERSHFRLSLLVFGGAFVGMVVWLSYSSFNVTAKEINTGR